jgi:hypothetical protein
LTRILFFSFGNIVAIKAAGFEIRIASKGEYTSVVKRKGRRPTSGEEIATALDRWDEEAERRTWRGLYPIKPAICGMWNAESWNVWVPPLSANGMIWLPTFSAGSSSTRPWANRTPPPG